MVHIGNSHLFSKILTKKFYKTSQGEKEKSNLSEEEIEAAKKLEMRSGDAFMSFVERGNLISITQFKIQEDFK